jgi:tetratricopeptide (TPR) repeat protein
MLFQGTHHIPVSNPSNYLRPLSRRLFLFGCAVLLLPLINVNPVSGFQQDAVSPLAEGALVGGDIQGSQKESFGISMEAGEYARVNVQRRGVDLLVTVTSPDGRNTTTYENPAGPQSDIRFGVIAGSKGTYIVAIQPIEKWAAAGGYQIRLEDLRQPSPQDEKRVAAERKVAEGRSKQLLDTEVSNKEAIASYQEANAIWRELDDVFEEANTLHFIAQTYQGLRNSQECVASYTRALELRGENDPQAKGYTLLGLASAYLGMNKFLDALSPYKQALEVFETTNNRPGQAAALYGMGLTKARLSEMTEALKYYEQALSIYTNAETRDRHEEARTLHAMGGAYDVMGEPQKAGEYFARALEGWRETGDPAQEGNTYSSLAKLEMDRGNWQVALDTYEKVFELYSRGEAASVREKPAIRRKRASSLYNVSYIYAALSDYPKAFELLDQSLALREPGDKGSTYMLMCYFQAMSSEPRKALETCARAIPEQQASGSRRIGETYTAMGVANAHLGDHKTALKLYDQALAIQQNVQTRSEQAEAITQGWRGESFAALGTYEQALAAYARARELWLKYNEPNGVALSLIGMARSERARNNLDVALTHVTEAIAAIEPLRTNVTSQELRINYFTTKVDYYELYIDLSMQLAKHGKANKDDRIVAAFEASEGARARSLTETLAKARIEGGVKSDSKLATLVSKYRRIQRQIQAAKFRVRKENQTTGVAGLREEQAQIESQLRAEYPNYAALMYPQPLKAAEVQKLLDPDTLLLEFALGEERSYVWAVSATKVDGYELPPRSKIEDAAKQLVNYLRDGQKIPGESASQHKSRLTALEREYWPQATAFSRMLLGDILSLSKSKHLVIIPDGQLQYLPFSALPAPHSTAAAPDNVNARASVLAKDHDVTNLPSASVLSVLRQTPRREQPAKLLAIFADPIFEPDDSRIQSTQRKNPVKRAPEKEDALTAALRDES